MISATSHGPGGMSTNVYPSLPHLGVPHYFMKNILIVDDDTVFLHSLEEMLTLIDGHRIYTAENGEQATAVLASVPVDLLITDLRMPVMGGQELILRTRKAQPDLPIVVISACAQTSAMQELEGENCNYLDKPINVTELISTVRKLIH